MRKLFISFLLVLLFSIPAYPATTVSGRPCPGGASAACTQSNDSALVSYTSDDTISAAITASEWRGQGFTVGTAFDLTVLRVKMQRGTSTSACTYTGRVYPMSNFYDTGLGPYTAGGASASSAGILGSNIPESLDIVDFLFSPSASLPAGAYFWAISAAGTNCDASYGYEAGSPAYAYGVAADSHAGANTWVADPASDDYFVLYGCAGSAGTVWFYSGTAGASPSTHATGSNERGEMTMMLLPGAMSITKAGFYIHTVGSATACKWGIVNNAGESQASGTINSPTTGWNDVSFTSFTSVEAERIYVTIECNATNYEYGTDSTADSYYCSPDYADFTGAGCVGSAVDTGLDVSVRLGY